MKKTLLPTNENGSVIVLALIMLVLLTLLGMAVSRTSSIEVQIASNDQQAVDNLYKAESADHYAIELSRIWLSNTFLQAADTVANVVIPTTNPDPNDVDGDGAPDVNLDIDGDGNDDIRIEIRCIEGTGTAIVPPAGNLSAAANNLPVMQHITVPPVNSGTSLGGYVIRRYGITGTTLSGGGQVLSQVQVGAYKVFNNFVN
jgi:PilX N-terminal